MEVLRRAGGVPVSYAELNDAGVEFPASVVSELELAGVGIERCFGQGPTPRRMLGVRLVARADSDPGPVGARTASRPIPGGPRRGDWEPVRVYRAGAARALLEGALIGALRLVETGQRWRRAAAGRPAIGSRMLRPLALLAAVGVGVAVAVSALPGSGGQRAHAARARHSAPAIVPGEVIAARRPRAVTRKEPRRGTRSTSDGSTRTTSTATTPAATTSSLTTPAAPATQATLSPASTAPEASASATGLEARGHQLMVAGRYDKALPVLRRALRATGEHPGACSEPTTPTCLTYAFALYDLGRSLRLAGHPAAAVPILKHRLQINNQRPVVAAELRRARRQASRRKGWRHPSARRRRASGVIIGGFR